LTLKGQGTASTPIVSPKTLELREAGFNRREAEKDLLLYVTRLVAGYEYRTYWYELFECFRKVPVLGLEIGLSGSGSCWDLLDRIPLPSTPNPLTHPTPQPLPPHTVP
jgi:hypothetical protein